MITGMRHVRGGERQRLVDEVSLRISDADRDLIASVSRQHAAEGRLTIRSSMSAWWLTRRSRAGRCAGMAGSPSPAPPEVHHRRHLGHERGEAAVRSGVASRRRTTRAIAVAW